MTACITVDWLAKNTPIKDADFYLCGPKPFLATFVNGLVIPGATLDATRVPGANEGRFGHFSDLYFDPIRDEWWALSDRGPGGGLLDYAVRVQRVDVQVNPITGRISNFRVKETVTLTDKYGLLPPPAEPCSNGAIR